MVGNLIGPVYWPGIGRMEFEVRLGSGRKWEKSYRVVIDNLDEGLGWTLENKLGYDKTRDETTTEKYGDPSGHEKKKLPEELLQLVRDNLDYFRTRGVDAPCIDEKLIKTIINNSEM